MTTSLSTEESVFSPHIKPLSDTMEIVLKPGGSQMHSSIESISSPAVQMGKPKNLGITQIVLGILFIIFWAPLILSPISVAGGHRTHLCGGLSFIVSGSLWCILEKTLTTGLVVTCLVLNLINALLGIANIVVFCIYFEIMTPLTFCPSGSGCDSWTTNLARYRFIFISVLYLLAMLELLISVFVVISRGKKLLTVTS